jgi:hypothetical protein
MRRFLLILSGFLFLVSCGGGGGSSSGGGGATDPNLTLSNVTANVQVGQSARVDFGYNDSEGNISTVFIREQFNTKDVTSNFAAGDFFISGNSGATFFNVSYPTTASRGQHNYEVWVTDAKGNRSNTLTFTINVT